MHSEQPYHQKKVNSVAVIGAGAAGMTMSVHGSNSSLIYVSQVLLLPLHFLQKAFSRLYVCLNGGKRLAVLGMFRSIFAEEKAEWLQDIRS
jgi:hypothetical protein